MWKNCLSDLTALTIISIGSIVVSAKVAEANYCALPPNIDPSGILCQTQGIINETQGVIDEMEIEAAQRQQYLQSLYNACMFGDTNACGEYNYEMDRQLRHMDNVIQQQELYYQYR